MPKAPDAGSEAISAMMTLEFARLFNPGYYAG